MPANPFDWHSKRFRDAKWWRSEAADWERLATMAADDGDTEHAERAKRQAAFCRQVAREKELHPHA